MSDQLTLAPSNELKSVETSIEGLKSLYFDETAIREVDYTLYRLDSSGLRFYYTLDKDFNPEFFVSVTSKNDVVIPKGYGFHKWLASNNEEESEFIKESRACYGSMMHNEMAKLLIDRKYDLDLVPGLVAHTAMANGFIGLTKSWTIELYKDLLAFAQFIKEKDVVPVAVELMLRSIQYVYAGSIDLVCEMNFGRGRVRAIVDFKSSKKGNFYENHEVQLVDYKRMWNENFPDWRVTHSFNYSPNDWRTKPTYKLKNQTDACSVEKADNYLALFKDKKESDNLSPKDVLMVGGVIDLNESIDGLYAVKTASEFIKEQNESNKEKS